MHNARETLTLLALAGACIWACAGQAADPAPSGTTTPGAAKPGAAKPGEPAKQTADQLALDKQALAPLQVFVGQWRGVGQPRRGATAGSWIEEADWAWKFDKGRAALAFAAPKAKHFVAGQLERGDKEGQFRLLVTAADGKTQYTYTGASSDGRLVLSAAGAAPPDGQPTRIAIRTVAEGERLLVLYERRLGESDNFARLAEVGYTRLGGNFAKTFVERECVVTGGAGTIMVAHKGESYWVCCTGCRDLFNDDPEGVLAEYKAKKAAEKARKK